MIDSSVVIFIDLKEILIQNSEPGAINICNIAYKSAKLRYKPN